MPTGSRYSLLCYAVLPLCGSLIWRIAALSSLGRTRMAGIRSERDSSLSLQHATLAPGLATIFKTTMELLLLVPSPIRRPPLLHKCPERLTVQPLDVIIELFDAPREVAVESGEGIRRSNAQQIRFPPL